MNMCQWVSNEKSVLSKIKFEDRRTETVVKVLDLIWELDQDKLCINRAHSLKKDIVLSKRVTLKMLAGIYDPLGLVCPILMKPKILLQELWRKGVKWDENISEEIKLKWNKWVDKVNNLSNYGVSRCINELDGDHTKKNYELITFTDSSKLAYAAAVYLKISNGDNKKVNLVFAKNQISPIKEISIPRLELLGVLIGCRISKFVSEQLLIFEIKQTILTDSKCVLEWYKSNKELKRLVNDKIKEIRTYDIKIGYVKSKENPADIATRGVGVKELFENKLW